MTIKKQFQKSKWILFSVLVAAGLSALQVTLIEYQIIPKYVFKGYYDSYSTYREMFSDGLFMFFIFFIVTILIFLDIKYKRNIFLICPLCEEPQRINNKQDVVLCKKCGQKMVPLKGYYDKDKIKEN